MKKKGRRYRKQSRKAALSAAAPDRRVRFETSRCSLIAAEGGDSGERPKVKIVAYTGGAMRPMDSPGPRGVPWVIDLAGLDSSRPFPILQNHFSFMVLGHSLSATIEGGEVVVEATMSNEGDNVDEFLRLAGRGFPWQASLGLGISRVEEVRRGDSVEVNGREFEGPVLIARRSRIVETSILIAGADHRTSARIAASAGDLLMNFEAWCTKFGIDPKALSDDDRAELEASYQASFGLRAGDPAGDDPDEPESDDPEEPEVGNGINAGRGSAVRQAVSEARKAALDETRRISGIRKVCAGRHVTIEEQAIKAGWSVDQAELAILRAERPMVSGVRRGVSEAAPRALECAIARSAGLSEKSLAASYDERTREAADSADLRGAGMQTLFYETLRASGGDCRIGSMNDGVIRAALEADTRLRASGIGFSTISVSGILSNVANKVLIESFLDVDSVIPRIAREIDVPDFKKRSSYRLTSIGDFGRIGANGELNHGELVEEEFENQIDTHGELLTLSRKDIVNDDLNAFMQIPRHLGRKAAIAREKAFFTLLLANPASFFGSGNDNFQDGAATALSIDSLSAAFQALLSRQDAAGHPIMLRPSVVLVPTSLHIRARQLANESRVNETTTVDSPSPANNPHAGTFEPVSSPWLNAQGLTGSSALAWYVFADPREIAAIEVAYLSGRRQPTIEGGSADFDTLGMRWRAYWDFGMALQDSRAAEKMKGES